MKLSTLQRLGGISIIIGAVLFTAWAVCWPTLLPVQEQSRDFSAMVLHPNWIWIASLALPGVVLMVFGFTAVYSRFYQEAGALGLTGYVFISLAYILQGAQLTWEIFLYPIIAGHAPSMPLFRDKIMLNHPLFAAFRVLFDTVIFAGVVAFSAALIRSKQFPKIAGVLILCGALVYAVGPMFWIYFGIIGVLVLSAGCVILGLKLVKKI